MLGRGQIIKKAIHFSLERTQAIKQVFNVDLKSVKSIEEVILEISQELEISNAQE